MDNYIGKPAGMKKILAISISIFTLLGFCGVTLFDVTLFRSASRKSNVKNELISETPVNTPIPNHPIEEKPPPNIRPQETRDDGVVKLPISKLIGILSDLPLSSDKLTFIQSNMDIIPEHVSLDDLHRILALFSRDSDELRIIEVFLSRLPNRLSLRELNRILALFSRADDRLKVTRTFVSRLEDVYPDSEFEIFKDHWPRSRDKMKAINLLLRRFK